MRGLVFFMYLIDILMKNLEKKYYIGDEVKCWVLFCDFEVKKLMMILKKILVEFKLFVIICYVDVKFGLQIYGFIIRVKDYGCIVKFYNNVQGLVFKYEFSIEYIFDLERVFYIGQVVKVVVLNCELFKERMFLFFKLLSDLELKKEFVGYNQKKGKVINIGQLVDVKVLEKIKDGLEVVVLLYNICVFFFIFYLLDYVVNGLLLYYWFQVGDIFY